MSDTLLDLRAATEAGSAYIVRRAAKARAKRAKGEQFAASDAPFPILVDRERRAVASEVQRIWERLGAGYSDTLNELRASLAEYVVAGISRGYGEAALFLASGRPTPPDAATLIQAQVMSQAKHDLAAVREVIRNIAGGQT